MDELVKIKMSDQDLDLWPSFLKEVELKSNGISLEIESERKLCDLCDYLFFSEDKLQYHSHDLGNMVFDFGELLRYHQRQQYALSKEPLAKALGIKGEKKPFVWDITCGSGKDSVLIHTFGTKIKSFERNPLVYLLLKDALRRDPLDIEIVFADASRSSFSQEVRPDVIYYDPMYPEKNGSKKSALPRKEMRIFKDIVGDDPDCERVLEWALQTAKERVVVKRSLKTPPVLPGVSASYEGKSTRYDMYKIF